MNASFVEPQLSLDLHDAYDQELLIAVQGEDVLHFEGNEREELPANRRVLPDPVSVFVHAVGLGMFAGPLNKPSHSEGEVLSKNVDLERRRQSWRLRLQSIDARAIQVLANMLQARLLDQIVIQSDLPSETDPRRSLIHPLRGGTFPHPHPSTSLVVEYRPSDRLSRERTVELVCRRDAHQFAEQIFAGLETWATLLMLGGYPDPTMRPYQSAAISEPAFLLDAQTIQMSFPDLFLCDEECFAAVVNYAQAIHETICPVERLIII